jgi:segregation and condensation protein A
MQDRSELPTQTLPLNLPEGLRLDLRELWKALERIVERAKREEPQHMEREEVTLAGQLASIRQELTSGRTSFRKIFQHRPQRVVVVVTFLALLELVRLGEVQIYQEENFGDILIEGCENGTTDAGRN